MIDLKSLRKAASEATPGPWGPWSGNYPFNVDVKKPAPSLSKHDDQRPTYWRYQDVVHVLEFNPKIALELLDKLELAIKTIEDFSSPSYGMELCNTDSENLDIICNNFFDRQRWARKVLKEIKK